MKDVEVLSKKFRNGELRAPVFFKQIRKQGNDDLSTPQFRANYIIFHNRYISIRLLITIFRKQSIVPPNLFPNPHDWQARLTGHVELKNKQVAWLLCY